MKRRAEAAGDSKSVHGFLERMVTLHGEGGSENKKSKGQHAFPCKVTSAHRVQSFGLHEAAENDNTSDDEIWH